MNMRAKIADVLLRVGGAANRKHALDDADAILDALYEPTPEMIDAGCAACSDDHVRCRVSKVFQAMIAQAKAER